MAHYEDSYGRGKFEGLRSAHNYFVTLYGRLGVVGSLIFGVITIQLIVGGLRAGLAAGAGVGCRWPI